MTTEMRFVGFKGTISILLLTLMTPSIIALENCVDHFHSATALGGISEVIIANIDLNEDQAVGTEVFSLTWDDPGTAPPPIGDDFQKYFEVTASDLGWTVKVKESLVGVPDYPTRIDEIKGDTTFTGFPDFETCTLTIAFKPQDINTQIPEFDQPTYTLEVSEDFPTGFSVDLDLKIKDDDNSDPNNVVDVEVDTDCPIIPSVTKYGDFKGDFKSVPFQLKDKLDYEGTQEYTCTVTLKDEGTPPLKTSTDVQLTVTAVDDEDPTFSSGYYLAELDNPVPDPIEGKTPLTTSPGPIEATDGDKGITPIITYSMNDGIGPGTTYLEIDSSSGVVSLVNTIEDEVLQEYRQFVLTLTATDGSGAMANATLLVNLPLAPTTTATTTTTTTATPTTSPTEVSTSEETTDLSTSTIPYTTTEYISSSSMTTSPSTGITTPSSTSSSITPGSTSDISSTESSVVTESTTSSDVVPSRTSTALTPSATSPGPEAHLTFTKSSYAGQIFSFFDLALIVDVTVEYIDREDVIFSLDKYEELFSVLSPSGEIRVVGDLEEGQTYSFEVLAEAKTTTGYTLNDRALVQVNVLTAVESDIYLPESLHLATINENIKDQPLFNVTSNKLLGTVCTSNFEPEAYKDHFTVDTQGERWQVSKSGEGIDFNSAHEIKFILQAFDTEGVSCDDISTPFLLRNQAMVIVTIEDINNNSPEFKVPSGTSEFIAYPTDVALQKVVGPVITLQAEDADVDDTIEYSITNKASGFSVEKETGAIYVEGGFDCPDDGCEIIVLASDGEKNTPESTIKVKPLAQDEIYTIVMSDTEVSEVDEELKSLSADTNLQIGKVYVNPAIQINPTNRLDNLEYRENLKIKEISSYAINRTTVESSKSLLQPEVNEDILWELEVNVYVFNATGKVVSLADFNKKLDEASYKEAVPFVDSFTPSADGSDTGLIVAVSILATLLGIVLLAGGFLMYRQRKAGKKAPKNISSVGAAYPNHGFSDDDGLENKSTLGGSIGRAESGIIRTGDSPPLHKSGFVVDAATVSKGSGNDELQLGLKRTDPGSPEYYGLSSREPPPSYLKTNTKTSALASTSSSSTPLYSTASTTGDSTSSASYLLKNPKKSPPSLKSAPAKSILRGAAAGGGSSPTEDIPLYPSASLIKDPPKPEDPETDYNNKGDSIATSKFSGLKGSPTLERTAAPVGGSEDESEDGKKSNLKPDNADPDNDEEKKSVAFKVLVTTKVVETQNKGPAEQAAAAVAASLDAIDILEANKLKISKSGVEEEEEEEEDGDTAF